MSESNGSKNGRNGGVIGALSRLGEALVGALPPAFLLLVVMNIAFLAVVLWFIQSLNEQRAQFALKVLDACILEMRNDK